MHVHGTAVPIVDLRRLLPAGTPPRTAKPKVVLARLGRRRVGLRVDGMAGVRRYTAAEINRVARCLACWVSPRTSAGSWISASC